MAKPLRVGIIAGEHSGDILGAGLISAIQAQHPNVTFEGIAGPKMKALGCQSIFDMEELAVMGLFEVLGRLPRLLSIKKQIIQHFIDNPPDVFIGIDAPDFNLRVELALKNAGITTVQYVSPSVWAWRPKRIFKIAAATNLVLSLLPFEKAFYDKHDVPCQFVGHTLADDIALEHDQQAARKQLSLSDDDVVLALLPGSRSSEVGLLSECYLETANLLAEKIPNLKVVVPLVNDARKQQFKEIATRTSPNLALFLLDGQADMAIKSANAVLLASGTATLETMLYKKPMVVGYKLKPTSYWVYNTFFNFTIKYFSLPNLLADAPLVTELLQNDCHPHALEHALYPLLTSDNLQLIQQFTDIHQAIRCNASEKAAQAVLELINAN
ncbi:lipid-A-disaccharide synthase [Pseudoalteromonas ulvae UL12]|uniref:lipid-A-disaccharide synthase n=1 Tax=Pseudoalteromonas ulvae TaxID=107327 RepID=UPI00186B8B3B|nr:lipid-A-disaccharide synthase [Pseudoalteromonas ulvae]MBE0363535.1 lipid-A-disaccharide synthase [Pseudoalteromonas ulvae UL12]